MSIKELSNEPLILFSRALDPQTCQEIQDVFTREGAAMNVALELNSLLSMLNFIATGLGCALLPDYLRDFPRKGIVYKPLSGRGLIKTMAIARKQGKGGLGEAFYGFTVDNL